MKNNLYPILIALFLGAGVWIFMANNQKKNEIPTLKERKVNIGVESEWLNTKQAIDGLLDKIRRNPNDQQSKLQLAMGYIQEGRVTGDHAYYDEAAQTLISQILEKDPNNYDALCVKATIQLSQHHFADGFKTAMQAKEVDSTRAYGYGILCDANVELGNYPAAVEAADKMNAIRPDLRSYARASYLREIYGDYPGAKAAMDMAAKAGAIGLEQTEWCRVLLGRLYEITGDTATAHNQYSLALSARPDYPYALAGFGRLAKIGGRYDEAIGYFEQAAKNVQDFAMSDELTDLYLLKGDKQKSMNMANEVIEKLKKHASKDDAPTDKGHYADKELAYAYLKVGDTDKALEHAIREWNRRPENIDVNEALAWVYYKRNDIPNAAKYIQKALVTGSKNPVLLQRAGQIFLKNNEAAKGNALIADANKINPLLKNVN